MPELPEVETVRRILEEKMVGRTIEDIDIYYNRIIQNQEPKDFIDALKGKQIIGFKRHGKYLIFCLSDDIYLVSHLRMEGKYYIKDINEPKEKHEHIIFYLDNNLTLRYHDTRKFGTMEIKNKDNLYSTHPLNDLGPDGISNIDFNYLKEALNKKRPIKELLLDQSIIAGIGNIYADEICFKAKLNPTHLGSNLTDENINDIIKYTKDILLQSISDGGTTIRSYTSQLGVTGRFQQHLCIHTLENCSICGAKVEKIRVGGRGTYYCPNCQK